MTELIAEKTFEAILRDDAVSFGALMEKDRIGAYRYGRFPVLSLMYLFKSKKTYKSATKRSLSKSLRLRKRTNPLRRFQSLKRLRANV